MPGWAGGGGVAEGLIPQSSAPENCVWVVSGGRTVIKATKDKGNDLNQHQVNSW